MGILGRFLSQCAGPVPQFIVTYPSSELTSLQNDFLAYRPPIPIYLTSIPPPVVISHHSLFLDSLRILPRLLVARGQSICRSTVF